MTKAADQLETVLDSRFPGVRFGRYNCRTISGSSTYSQHSWPGGNARDLYAPTDHPDPMAFLDEVNTWLAWNTEALSIRLILWRVRDHYGHAHVDFWPHGSGVPPCAGGESRYQYSDGHTVLIRDPDPENGYYQESEDEVDEDTLRRIVREELVAVLGGDTITLPDSERKGNQGIVNSVWWSTIHGERAYQLLTDAAEGDEV